MQWQWSQVIPVFFSAFSAMLVGICLELFKSSREKKKKRAERETKELQQINGVIAGIAYNIEGLLHATYQHVLPHVEDSTAAMLAFNAATTEGERAGFAMNIDRYPVLSRTYPEMYFTEFDFLEKLPFLIEKDPELVKKAGWLTSYSRIFSGFILEHNKIIDQFSTTISHSGQVNVYQLKDFVDRQHSRAIGEAIHALELFNVLLSVAESLKSIATKYEGQKQVTKIVSSEHLTGAITSLKTIAAKYMPQDISPPPRKKMDALHGEKGSASQSGDLNRG